MARSFLRENQLGDPDVLSEGEHRGLTHDNLVVSGTLTVSGVVQLGIDSDVWWDDTSSELRLNTVISGVYPTKQDHLTTRLYVDDKVSTTSGVLQDQVDAKPDSLIELDDTFNSYIGHAKKLLFVNSSETGVVCSGIIDGGYF